MLDIPYVIVTHLCVGCDHGMNCVEPRIKKLPDGGLTCMSYAPVRGDTMKPDHILALPDREPCHECACRKGTQASETPHTVANFVAATDRLEPFLCHGKGEGRVCAGWLQLTKRKILASREGAPQ